MTPKRKPRKQKKSNLETKIIIFTKVLTAKELVSKYPNAKKSKGLKYINFKFI